MGTKENEKKQVLHKCVNDGSFLELCAELAFGVSEGFFGRQVRVSRLGKERATRHVVVVTKRRHKCCCPTAHIAGGTLQTEHTTRKGMAPATTLTARCAEIVEWRRTGILKGTVLREFASARYGEEHDAIQRAENDTLQEAIELVTSMKAAS